MSTLYRVSVRYRFLYRLLAMIKGILITASLSQNLSVFFGVDSELLLCATKRFLLAFSLYRKDKRRQTGLSKFEFLIQ